MITNRKIYLKCLDDMKYMKIFDSIIAEESEFIKNHKPIKEDFHNVGASKQYLDKISEVFPQLKKDYNFLINYMKDEKLSNNGDDAEEDIAIEYSNLFEKFCRLSDNISNLTKETESLRQKISKRSKN